MGTRFGNIHSDTNLHLIEQSVIVHPAPPRFNLIEVPGVNGTVDLSDKPAGRITYGNRLIEWTYALYPNDDWDQKISQVSNAINGLKCDIILDSDPRYKYTGRVSVSEHNIDKCLRQIKVQATVNPYKRDSYGGTSL